MAQIEVQQVQEVQKVQIHPIRLIRLIRGREEGPILWRTALQAAFVVGYLYPRALPPVTQSSALQAPEHLRIPVMNPSYPFNPW